MLAWNAALSQGSIAFAKNHVNTGALQGKPYAFFGTCLGAIVAYEVTRRIIARKYTHSPVAFFLAAVSAPHLYSTMVNQIWVEKKEGEQRSPLEPHTSFCCTFTFPSSRAQHVWLHISNLDRSFSPLCRKG